MKRDSTFEKGNIVHLHRGYVEVDLADDARHDSQFPAGAAMDSELPRERFCCDGLCFQRNPSQGGSCPLIDPIPDPVTGKTQRESLWWVGAGVAASLVFVGLWIYLRAGSPA